MFSSLHIRRYEPHGGGGPPGAAPPHGPPESEALLLREPERQGVYFLLPHRYRVGQHAGVSVCSQ